MATAFESVAVSNDVWRCRARVQRRLAGVRRSMRAHLFWEGLAWTAATGVGLAALSLALDRWLRPELSSRLMLLVMAVVLIAVVGWRFLLQPLSWRLDDLDLAELLDRRLPGAGQRLTNVLELPLLADAGHLDGSPAMIEAAVLDDAAALEKIDFHAAMNVPRRRKLVGLLVGTIALVAVFCYLTPTVAAMWSKRWLTASSARWPQSTYLSVRGLNDDGRVIVPRGEAANLEVDAQPEFVSTDGGWRLIGRGEDLFVLNRDKPQSTIPESVTIDYRLASGDHKQGTLTHFDAGRFGYELPPLGEPASFTLVGGDDWTAPIEILPLDRPAVKDLSITAHIPGRTEPQVFHAGQGDAQLLFLPTTRLELSLTADQPLATAAVVATGDVAPKLDQVDAHHYRTELVMKDTVTLEFQLVGQRGNLASKSFFLTLGLQTDRPPRVTIRITGVGRRVTPTARIPLALRAIDDFGISQLVADFELTQIVDSKPQTSVQQPYAEKFVSDTENLPTDIEKQPLLKLTDLNVAVGNVVRLRGRATDACVLGQQDGSSRWVTLQVVTPEELFYEILTRQREQRGRFAKALEMAKGQSETIQRLTSASDGGSLTRVHQVVARQVAQIATQLDGTLQEMTYNDLGSSQARELLEQSIIVPMRKLHDEALVSLGDKLQTLLSQNEPRESERELALEAQQSAVAEMQRILSQMSQWESFVDVINQLRQIMKSQNEILQSTETVEKERIKGLFD